LAYFHIHIDGQCVPPPALEAIARLPVAETPFRRDLMSDGFEAPFHYTHKTTDSRRFKEVYHECCNALKGTGFEGYVEGECLAYDDVISQTAISGTDLRTINVEFQELADGAFRETELHVAFERGSDDEAVVELKQLGFFSAFMDKAYGVSEILTLQGQMQPVLAIEEPIRAYLRSRKSLRHCSIKREDIARFWLTRQDIKRAPILVKAKVDGPMLEACSLSIGSPMWRRNGRYGTGTNSSMPNTARPC
jgi:hypothetical protein